MPGLAPLQTATAGPLELKVKLPLTVALGREPLVSIGYKNRYQLLAIQRRDDKNAVFEIEGTGSAKISGTAPFAPDIEHTLIFSTGSLFYATAQIHPGAFPYHDGIPASHVALSVDGVEIIHGEMSPVEVGPTSLALGRNTVLAAGVSDRFSGELHR